MATRLFCGFGVAVLIAMTGVVMPPPAWADRDEEAYQYGFGQGRNSAAVASLYTGGNAEYACDGALSAMFELLESKRHLNYGDAMQGCVDAVSGTSSERNYFRELAQVAHPRVDNATLLFLGQQACGVRRSGMSTDHAKVAVSAATRNRTGYIASNAEVGSLVHVAVDNLCPEVGYP